MAAAVQQFLLILPPRSFGRAVLLPLRGRYGYTLCWWLCEA